MDSRHSDTHEEQEEFAIPLDGILVIDKPEGPTSHDVVYRVRRELRGKVGHTGTLDPQATGVLPIMLGKATRLMRFLSQGDKVYEAEIRLGQSTDTYDGQGEVVFEAPVPELSRACCLEVLDHFQGTIEQVPPMYSAVRIQGKRLYQEARAGREVKRPSRQVTLYSVDLIEQQSQLWRLRVHCSAGTYVRTLAHDIGQAIGCGAFLSRLTRTRSGQFTLQQAVPLSASPDKWRQKLIPLEELLPEFPRLDLTQQEAVRVSNGNPVAFNRGEMQTYRLFHQNLLYAIARMQQGQLHPFVVLRTHLSGPSCP